MSFLSGSSLTRLPMFFRKNCFQQFKTIKISKISNVIHCLMSKIFNSFFQKFYTIKLTLIFLLLRVDSDTVGRLTSLPDDASHALPLL